MSVRVPPVVLFSGAAVVQHVLGGEARPTSRSVASSIPFAAASVWLIGFSLREFRLHRTTVDPIDFRVDGRAEVAILADRQRLTQALLQLLSNAIRYTQPDDQIAVGARVRDDELVEIWVRDTGKGIDPADHTRVFERFERGSSPVSPDDAGGRSHNSGLGLSIVAAIAKAHGGRIDLISAPGRGSTFTLVLPSEPPIPSRKEARS